MKISRAIEILQGMQRMYGDIQLVRVQDKKEGKIARDVSLGVAKHPKGEARIIAIDLGDEL